MMQNDDKENSILDDDITVSTEVESTKTSVQDELNADNSQKSKKASKNEKIKKTGEIVPADSVLPNKLPIIPLQGRPIFPGIFTPLMVNSAEDTKVVEQAYSSDGYIGIVMLKNEEEIPSYSDLHSVGTAAKIIKKINLPDGGVNVFISTIKRFKTRKALHVKTPIIAAVDYLDDEEDDTFEVKALTVLL